MTLIFVALNQSSTEGSPLELIIIIAGDVLTIIFSSLFLNA